MLAIKPLDSSLASSVFSAAESLSSSFLESNSSFLSESFSLASSALSDNSSFLSENFSDNCSFFS